MSELQIGDAVRIKGQKGRPVKWVISQIFYEEEEGRVALIMYKNPEAETLNYINNLAPYSEYAKKEKIIEKQL